MMLALRDVRGGYGSGQVLFGVDLEIDDGRVATLLGRNGMGKTSTVRAVMGMLPARSGQIVLAGRSIVDLPPHHVARVGVGLVPEGRRLFGSLSVQENLLATARKGASWSAARVYELFPRLQERRFQRAGTLSGGEQQMLAIGRALLTGPKLLILDEATEGLAPLVRAEIWRCLAMLKQSGLTILMIDRNLEEMAALVDTHHIVEKGRVIWRGSPDELAAQPELAHRHLGI